MCGGSFRACKACRESTRWRASILSFRPTVPTTWTADLIFGDRLRVTMQPAAIVQRANTVVEGLLPAAIFQKIYVDQVRQEVVLVR